MGRMIVPVGARTEDCQFFGLLDDFKREFLPVLGEVTASRKRTEDRQWTTHAPRDRPLCILRTLSAFRSRALADGIFHSDETAPPRIAQFVLYIFVSQKYTCFMFFVVV